MQREFWHEKWQSDNLGFHEGRPNSLLSKNFSTLALDKKDRVFVPLCGKTTDIDWFLSNGYCVAGAELSEKAVRQLFVDLDIVPEITGTRQLKHYSSSNIDIFVGDIFDVSSGILGHVDAVYDRAALVALPIEMRESYTSHIVEITNAAPQLLICFEYNQSLLAGPPFSIPGDEVRKYYGHHYDVSLIDNVNVDGGLKGVCAATEAAWLLENN